MWDPVNNVDQPPTSSILPFVTRELPSAEPSKAEDTSMLTCFHDMAYLITIIVTHSKSLQLITSNHHD